MTPHIRQRLTVCLSIAIIVASCTWIYFHQFKAAKYNIGLHQRVGEVLAEQTARVVGKSGSVVTIAMPTREWPELETEMQAFKATLQKLGKFDLREYSVDPKDQPKYGVGSGLSGRRYVRTLNKNLKADVIVSFLGAPDLSEEEVKELGTGKKPKLIALSRSTDNLPKLFHNQLIEVAVVSRFTFPSPAPDPPKTPQDWFIQRFQVVTAADVKAMLAP